ncbi:MAG: DUF2868 domain-containing protein, partial [Calditrichia bacterium]|nr:DUF2868 domain-containing protein [Calditrichia bacterium]
DEPLENKQTTKSAKLSQSFIRTFFLDWMLGGIYKKLYSFHLQHEGKKIDVKNIKKTLVNFWSLYRNHSGSGLFNRFNSLINVGAIGLVLGALAGIYIRGVFFEYNVIWKSTFMTDINSISTLVNILYGPASLIIDGKLISNDIIQSLINSSGVSAAPWIHKLSLTVALLVLIPRTLLSILFARKAKTESSHIDFNQKYFKEILSDTRENLVDIIRKGIGDIFRKRMNNLAENIAGFVREDYFDKYIATCLLSFKNNGGKISELEMALNEYQEQFKPVLSDTLKKEQNEFKLSVQKDIESLLGRELNVNIDKINREQSQKIKLGQELPGKLARDIGDTVGTTVTAAVAAAVGTISGGIGQTLGIAIISSILGVSGPIGLLIGSIGAGLAVGGTYKLYRKKVTDYIKKIHLPAFVVSKTLS